MARPPKIPPAPPTLQWRWEMRQQEFAKTLWQEGFTVTPQANLHAKDHRVDLHYVQGTGPGGRIGKSDVQNYVDQGKPVQRDAEVRYPTRTEMLAEMCKAKMNVSNRIGFNAIFLYEWMQVEEIDDEQVPVVYIEWGMRIRKHLARAMHRRDKRFSALRPRRHHPWGTHWGAV